MNKQNGRLTLTYFAPSRFGKDAFLNESVFFQIFCFLIIFSNFSNFNENFRIFSQKNLTKKVERHFQELIPFNTYSLKILPHLAIWKKFFEKNIYCSKKANFERYEKYCNFSPILRHSGYNLVKKHSQSEILPTSDIINWQTSGEKAHHLSEWFCLHII